MKTRDEVESLKAQWLSDPCWDIENTDGFEEYKDELTAFSQICDIERAVNTENKLTFISLKLGCNREFAQYIISLDQIVAALEKQVSELVNRVALLEHKVNNG